MSEEAATAPVAPRRSMRRRPAPPAAAVVKAAADRAEKPSMMAKMKARPNWESEDFVGVGMEGTDRLKIPAELVNALYRDGVALQWATKSVRGMETPQQMSQMTRGGWTPVHQSDFDGLLDGLFMPKGVDEPIIVEDCILVARPVEIQRKAIAAQRREASRPLQIAEEQIGQGIPGVTGSNHKSVSNTIKKSLETVAIPE